ncbi:MAG: hypothetical protein KA354_08195 [Phycisphaerae bacterium]|nr:hypothetical protein [Phycisphaerae bacterium]
MRRIIVPAILSLALPMAAGCYSNGDAEFDEFINGIAAGNPLPQLDPATVTIRVINESGYDSMFEYLVDGVSQTITCSKEQKLCEEFCNPCPTMIEPVSQSLLDPTTGGFVGGTVFTGRPEYTFQLGDDFECGSIILFQFEGAQITAGVY